MSTLVLACAAVSAEATSAAALPDPAELLSAIDGSRPSGQAARIELMLVTTDHGSESRRRYRVLDDGHGRSIVEFLDPLEFGQKLLATPDELWFFSARIHRAIRVPPSQRLFGEASYGDVARLQWSLDYEPRLDDVPEDSVAGQPCWRLKLSARDASKTYRQILLWVAKATRLPLQAQYFTASGKFLKSAEFPRARWVDGRVVNDVWLLRSATSTKRSTVLTIESVTPTVVEASHFTRRALEVRP
jgi:negative regulator of sigma E activity